MSSRSLLYRRHVLSTGHPVFCSAVRLPRIYASGRVLSLAVRKGFAVADDPKAPHAEETHPNQRISAGMYILRVHMNANSTASFRGYSIQMPCVHQLCCSLAEVRGNASCTTHCFERARRDRSAPSTYRRYDGDGDDAAGSQGRREAAV
jgi:hypothetical protein